MQQECIDIDYEPPCPTTTTTTTTTEAPTTTTTTAPPTTTTTVVAAVLGETLVKAPVAVAAVDPPAAGLAFTGTNDAILIVVGTATIGAGVLLRRLAHLRT